MKTRATKTEVFRFRCEQSLRIDLAKVAVLHSLDESDIARMALRRFINETLQPKNPAILANG